MLTHMHICSFLFVVLGASVLCTTAILHYFILCMCVSEDNLYEPVLFYHVGPEDKTDHKAWQGGPFLLSHFPALPPQAN